MWQASKCNQYVDFGSSLDFYSKQNEFPKKIKKGNYNFKRWKFVNEIDNFQLKENVPNAKITIYKR